MKPSPRVKLFTRSHVGVKVVIIVSASRMPIDVTLWAGERHSQKL